MLKGKSLAIPLLPPSLPIPHPYRPHACARGRGQRRSCSATAQTTRAMAEPFRAAFQAEPGDEEPEILTWADGKMEDAGYLSQSL